MARRHRGTRISDALPYQVAAWNGRDAAPLDAETVRALSADSYLNRTYTARPPAGRAVHRLLRPASSRASAFTRRCIACRAPAGRRSTSRRSTSTRDSARRLVVRKNRDRAVVLYWYAVHGRTIASEAISKAWLLHDSVRLRRTDAALVRIVVPVTDRDGTTDAAERQAIAFARDVIPFLSDLWS